MADSGGDNRPTRDATAGHVPTRGRPGDAPVESERFLASARADAAADAPYGVLDVGSNSIRLVVFEGLNRAPAPIFNERELCGLGATLAETGALAPGRGGTRARCAAPVLRGRNGTRGGPARRGDDGGGSRSARRRALPRGSGPRGRILAQGPLGRGRGPLCGSRRVSAFPGASGLMADLGGGSLELVRLEQGRLAEHATLPLGVLRLGSLKPGRRTALAAERLDTLPWLDRVRASLSISSAVRGGRWPGSTWPPSNIPSPSSITIAWRRPRPAGSPENSPTPIQYAAAGAGRHVAQAACDRAERRRGTDRVAEDRPAERRAVLGLRSARGAALRQAAAGGPCARSAP